MPGQLQIFDFSERKQSNRAASLVPGSDVFGSVAAGEGLLLVTRVGDALQVFVANFAGEKGTAPAPVAPVSRNVTIVLHAAADAPTVARGGLDNGAATNAASVPISEIAEAASSSFGIATGTGPACVE